MENLVTSKEVSEKLKKLGVRQNSKFYWRLRYSVSESFDNGVSLGKKGEFGDYRIEYLPKPRYTTADVKWNDRDLSYLDETEIAAYTISELKEPLKPYMKDIEISARDDIFNPDFWGNLLIHVKSNE